MNTIYRTDFRVLSLLLIFSLLTISVAQAMHNPEQRGNAAPGSGKRGKRRNSPEQITPQPPGGERFTPANGQTVHDNFLHVTWLTDANFAAKKNFGLPVTPGGSMDYATALKWVAALNADNHGAGYLGHKNWTLPATPKTDESCKATGPHGNSFGFGCSNSPMGSLFYLAFNLHPGETAVPIPANTVGGFKNFQPYLYWSETCLQPKQQRKQKQSSNGCSTFSFNTGWQGANVDHHVMYVLPMIQGHVPASSPAAAQTVYDPGAQKGGVTWLADANLAGDPDVQRKLGVSGINKDGSMEQTTAQAFIDAMNKNHYLGQNQWQLPPASSGPPCTMKNGGYNCTSSPMGHLFYQFLKQPQGKPVVNAPNIAVGPFQNLQPYLYWACAGVQGSNTCSGLPAAPGFSWSFSFGNGFQGTDLMVNDLYVMVYYPDPQAPKCSTPMSCCMQSGGTWSGGKCQ